MASFSGWNDRLVPFEFVIITGMQLTAKGGGFCVVVVDCNPPVLTIDL